MSPELKRSELEKIPYLKRLPGNDRSVSLRPFWDDKKDDWELWLEVMPGEMGRMAGGESVLGSYYAYRKQREDDVELPLLTFVTQFVSFPDTLRHASALENDLLNLAAVLEKYLLIARTARPKGLDRASLATTETEYLLFLARSMYDLLQSISSSLLKRITPVNDPSHKLFNDLGSSFRPIAMFEGTARTVEQIEAKFGFPRPLAEFYATEAPFFEALRRLRDGIAHRGSTVPTVFSLDKGLCVDVDGPIWKGITEWPAHAIAQNKLGSLRYLFAVIASHLLQMCDRYLQAFVSSFRALPPPINDELKVFLRGSFCHHLAELPTVLADPWEGTTN